MPLCLSKREQFTTEDLVELSEIEKQNLGQVSVLVFSFICIPQSNQVLCSLVDGMQIEHLSYVCASVE